jgi:hypothetical protein
MNANEIIMKLLEKGEVIPPKYTGDIILHCGEGGLCDISIPQQVRRKNKLGELTKIFLDIHDKKW